MIQLVKLPLLEKLAEEFLCMRSYLGGIPCPDVLLNVDPVLSVELQRLLKSEVLFMGPLAPIERGATSTA